MHNVDGKIHLKAGFFYMECAFDRVGSIEVRRS